MVGNLLQFVLWNCEELLEAGDLVHEVLGDVGERACVCSHYLGVVGLLWCRGIVPLREVGLDPGMFVVTLLFVWTRTR